MRLFIFLGLCFGLLQYNLAKVSVKSCLDQISTCSEMQDFCTSPEYDVWAKMYCPRYCGLCDDLTNGKTDPNSETMNSCVDKLINCFWYDDDMCFGKNEKWARENCPKRCGYCGDYKNLCHDEIGYCHKLSHTVCTEKSYLSWARMNCRKFCNLCAVPAKPTITPTTTMRPFIQDPLTVNESQNGQWSYWDAWSDCSVSCGGGVRKRNRSCTEPPPENGGDGCVGISIQSESCNSFMCPDCNRVCPWSGTMSKDCSICHCADTIVFGMVENNRKMPVGNVNVYAQSRQWEPMTTTNAFGQYTLQGICLMGENLVFKKDQFMESTCSPSMRNFTHWICDVTLNQTVPPTFIANPKNKVRMVGQGVVMCCKAEGQPDPLKYTWIKDGKELKGGINGELHMGNLQEAHSGHYSCRVETSAGITTSKMAKLNVQPKAEDTCSGKPDEDLIDLPDGCHAEENGLKITRVNIGRCSKKQCITSAQLNAVTCYDTWPTHCCIVNETSPLTVNCARFSYVISQSISCKCRECATLPQISGEVYGMQNGTKIPFKSGQIYIKGKLAGETNEDGFFSLTTSGDVEEVVLSVKNDIENKFMETMTTVKIIEDGNVPVKIVVPLKPKPILFNANLGHTMTLSSNNLAPFTRVSFPSNSIVTEDGKPFSGIVKTSIHFMDPRNLDDIEAAYGSVSTVGEDGSEIPLETYGMINYLFNDDLGNKLKLNSPVSYSIDASTFNISIDEDGNSKVYAWVLNMKTGKWVQSNRFQVQTQQTGKRRLLSTATLEVQVPPQAEINLKETYTRLTTESTIVVYTYYYNAWSSYFHNHDRIVQRFNTRRRLVAVTTRAERDRDDACVVAVKVYQDTSFQLPLRYPVTVTAITYNPSSSKYSGKNTQTTNDKGIACLTIFCDQNVTLYAQQAQSPVDLVTSNTHSLPVYYSRTNINRNTGVMFEAIESSYDPTAGKYSPVRKYEHRSECLYPRRDDYHFQFAPLVKPELFSPTYGEETHDNILSWYPDPKDKPERRSCFVKVRVTTTADIPVGLRLIAKSYQRSSSTAMDESTLYGTVDIGPIPDMSITPANFRERAACIEYRCAGVAFNDKELVRNLTTQVFITATNSRCRFKPRPVNMELYDRTFSDGISFVAMANRNYGPVYGIYIANGPKDTARNLCFAGSSRVSNIMKTDESRTLGTFECT